MAVASELEWVPETLYNSAITAVVSTYSRHRPELRSLPENIQFDVYYKVKHRLISSDGDNITIIRHPEGWLNNVNYCRGKFPAAM